jgi:CDGSH-type Zn-finger protein
MPTKILVKNNSSLKIEGDFEIVDQAGNKFDLAGRTKISLCRCGLSQDKPFCDDAHKRIPFNSEVTARALPPPVKSQN